MMYTRTNQYDEPPEARRAGWDGRPLPREAIPVRQWGEQSAHGNARGGPTTARADGAPLHAQGSTIARGITERSRLRRKLVALDEELADVRRRNRELEQASGELKGFARSLAHDLRQPVVATRSFGLALENALARDEKERASQYATRIGEATRWIGDYIEALLSLARISEARLAIEDVDLSELANGLLRELHEQDRGRSVLVDVQRDVHATGDPALLRLLLQNLLGNAWKFTSREEAARVSFSARTSPDGELVYSVVDNGAGFDMTYAGSLFQTFQRFHASSDFPGTGIGLANARTIVERHGGRIWAQAQPGAGAAFHFTLSAAGGIEMPSAAPRGRSRTDGTQKAPL